MSELTAELVAEVVAACQAGAEETAGALGRSLDATFTVTVGEAGTFAADAAPDGFAGPGLAMLMKFGDAGLVAVLPEASGLLPSWYRSPDPTGESRLSTLAQELSMLLVPETLMADDFRAAGVDNLGEALERGGIAADAPLVPLTLTWGNQTGQLTVLWPLAAADEFFPAQPEMPETTQTASEQAPNPHDMLPLTHRPASYAGLPHYCRTLLKIRVPVRVILAAKREKLTDVIEMAPGTIIKFDKPCDEPLHLYVGDQRVAEGEAVKVGDKFGLRLGSMLLPPEQFNKVRRQEAG
jgi:flagellar motor switch/type III secretory pathway protein FliN